MEHRHDRVRELAVVRAHFFMQNEQTGVSLACTDHKHIVLVFRMVIRRNKKYGNDDVERGLFAAEKKMGNSDRAP